MVSQQQALFIGFTTAGAFQCRRRFSMVSQPQALSKRSSHPQSQPVTSVPASKDISRRKVSRPKLQSLQGDDPTGLVPIAVVREIICSAGLHFPLEEFKALIDEVVPAPPAEPGEPGEPLAVEGDGVIVAADSPDTLAASKEKRLLKSIQSLQAPNKRLRSKNTRSSFCGGGMSDIRGPMITRLHFSKSNDRCAP